MKKSRKNLKKGVDNQYMLCYTRNIVKGGRTTSQVGQINKKIKDVEIMVISNTELLLLAGISITDKHHDTILKTLDAQRSYNIEYNQIFYYEYVNLLDSVKDAYKCYCEQEQGGY